MTHKDMITNTMSMLAEDKRVMFIGYNTAKGSRMYGTLSGVPAAQCIEMPVCENLMAGMAVGMALEGYIPVVCFERHDFVLLALDAIVNHIDKWPSVSGNQFKLPILIRAIVGSKSPLWAGEQHTQDYSMVLWEMLKHTRLIGMKAVDSVFEHLYEGQRYLSSTESGAVLLLEERDMYDKEVNELIIK